jgi:hypothetical protein
MNRRMRFKIPGSLLLSLQAILFATYFFSSSAHASNPLLKWCQSIFLMAHKPAVNVREEKQTRIVEELKAKVAEIENISMPDETTANGWEDKIKESFRGLHKVMRQAYLEPDGRKWIDALALRAVNRWIESKQLPGGDQKRWETDRLKVNNLASFFQALDPAQADFVSLELNLQQNVFGLVQMMGMGVTDEKYLTTIKEEGPELIALRLYAEANAPAHLDPRSLESFTNFYGTGLSN